MLLALALALALVLVLVLIQYIDASCGVVGQGGEKTCLVWRRWAGRYDRRTLDYGDTGEEQTRPCSRSSGLPLV